MGISNFGTGPMNFDMDAETMESALSTRANQWVYPTDFPQPTDMDNPNASSLMPKWEAAGAALGGAMGMPMDTPAPSQGNSLGLPSGASGIAPFVGDQEAVSQALKARMLRQGANSNMAQNAAVQQNIQSRLTGNKLGF